MKLWPGLHGSEPVPAWSDTGERIFVGGGYVVWKSIRDEMRSRKWEAWSAHMAWGAACVLGAIIGRIDHGWALALSIGAGLVWELAWWALSEHHESDRPSVLDWLAWILGACLAWAWVLLNASPTA